MTTAEIRAIITARRLLPYKNLPPTHIRAIWAKWHGNGKN